MLSSGVPCSVWRMASDPSMSSGSIRRHVPHHHIRWLIGESEKIVAATDDTRSIFSYQHLGEQALFSVSPIVDNKAVEQIFRHNVLKMLLAKGKITRDMIAILDKWRHSGFNVFFGPRILPRQEDSMENLARYIVRASFSRERMTYHRETGQVGYQSKDGKETRVFDALEWLAAMLAEAKLYEDWCSHVPNKGESRRCRDYYGYYSNVARGKRKKTDSDDKIPCILEPELTDKVFRKNWARLIQKIAACPGHDPGKLIHFCVLNVCLK